jgi:hypothetical protein
MMGGNAMNRNTIRWVVAVLMLLALALGLSCPAIVEAESVKLPMDFTKGGVKTDKENWTYDGKIPTAYKDSTIEVTSEKSSVTAKVKGKNVKHEVWVVRIRIQDPSQLRTAVSKDTYNGRGQAKGEDIAKSKNADAMIESFRRKMEKQKSEADVLQKTINTIGNAINEVLSKKGDKKN